MKKGRKFSIFFSDRKWNKDHYKKNKKGEKEQGELVVLKIFNFLSTFFWSKDFISQESPILADVDSYQK